MKFRFLFDFLMRIEAMGKPPGCKLIRLDADIENGIIRTLRVRGDFFASPEEAFDRVEERLSGTFPAELAVVFDALIAEEGIAVSGISGAGLEAVLLSARETKGERA